MEHLPGLGPRSREMLAAAGIMTVTQLRELGAVRAYARVRATDVSPSLNLLWALEGALTGLPWQVVAREHRLSLLLALDALGGDAGRAPSADGGSGERLAPVPRKPASKTLRETRILQPIAAPAAVVYRLLLDPGAIAAWKVPDGMTCQVHQFEPREGGRFRVSLTHTEAGAVGKSTGHTDTYHGSFVRLRPAREIVERLAFETTDPRMQGWMTASYRLTSLPTGTALLAIHGDVPPGVSLRDNHTGWAMALSRLADLAAISHAAKG